MVVKMDDCLFCKIVTGLIPVPPVAENHSAIVIRDKNPIAPHHVLAISRIHYKNFDALDTKGLVQIVPDMLALLSFYVHENKLNETGYRIVMNTGPDAGQTVHHLHIHLLGGATLKNDFGA